MKTTKKHFEVFKKECQRWIDKFELNTWEITFVLSNKRGEFANCLIALDSWRAVIGFCIEWDDRVIPISGKEIRKVAKHEVIHLLFGRFTSYAHSRFMEEDQLVLAEEELVRMLLKIIK